MSESATDLRTMPEARVRDWFDGLPKEELVEMLVSHVLVYERDRLEGGDDDAGPGLGELRELTFAQLIERLAALTGHPELSRFRVDGERVAYVTESGIEVPINATGERDPGPSLGRQASPMTSPRPTERPPDAHVIDPAPAAPSRPARPAPAEGPMFSGGSASERRGGMSGGRPKAPPPPPPSAAPAPAKGAKNGSGGKKGGGSLLEF